MPLLINRHKIFTENILSKFAGFYKRVGLISRYSIFNFAFTSITTNEEPRTGKPVDFTPEIKDVVVWYTVSHILKRPMVKPPKNAWRDSTQSKSAT